MKKKVLSMLLAVCMIVGLLPATVLADDPGSVIAYDYDQLTAYLNNTAVEKITIMGRNFSWGNATTLNLASHAEIHVSGTWNIPSGVTVNVAQTVFLSFDSPKITVDGIWNITNVNGSVHASDFGSYRTLTINVGGRLVDGTMPHMQTDFVSGVATLVLNGTMDLNGKVGRVSNWTLGESAVLTDVEELQILDGGSLAGPVNGCVSIAGPVCGVATAALSGNLDLAQLKLVPNGNLDITANSHIITKDLYSESGANTLTVNGTLELDAELGEAPLYTHLFRNGATMTINEGGVLKLNPGNYLDTADAAVPGTVNGNGTIKLYAIYDESTSLYNTEAALFGRIVDRPSQVEETVTIWRNWDRTLRALSAPTDLVWGSFYTDQVQGDYFAYNGMISWKIADAAYDQDIKLTVYKNGRELYSTLWSYTAEGNNSRVYQTDWDFSLGELEYSGSGDYHYTVQAMGDGETTSDSEIVTSPVWKYTQPDDRLGAPVLKGWEGASAEWNAVSDTNTGGYVVDFYYSATEANAASADNLQRVFGFVQYNGEGRGEMTSFDISREEFANHKGYYYFNVTTVSDDVTAVQHSEPSALSAAYYNAEGTSPSATVTYESNGGSAVAPETIDLSEKLHFTEPAAPTKANYTFAGWYCEPELENLYIFDEAFPSPGDEMTLFAKWMDYTLGAIDIVGPNGVLENNKAIKIGVDGKVFALQQASAIGEDFLVPQNTTLPLWRYVGWTFSASKGEESVIFGTTETLTSELAAWVKAMLDDDYELKMDSAAPGVYTLGVMDIVGPNGVLENNEAIKIGADGKVFALQQASAIGEDFLVPQNTTLPLWRYVGWTFSASKGEESVIFGTTETLTSELAAWVKAMLDDGYELKMDSKTPGIYTPSSGSSSSSNSSTTTPTVTPGKPSTSPTVDTDTTTNTDGSTTTTETKKDGTVVETTTNTDGTTTKTETQKDGTVIETETKADGSSSTTASKSEVKENRDGSTTTTTTTTNTTTDAAGKTTSSETVEKKVETATGATTITTTTTKEANGTTTKSETVAEMTKNADGTETTTSKTETTSSDGSKSTTTVDKTGKVEAEVKITGAAVNTAAKAEEAVSLPMPEVEAAATTETAPTVAIDVPSSTDEVKVEIPVAEANAGTVAVIVHANGTEEIVMNTALSENGVVIPVSGDVTVKIVDNSQDFEDVADSAWYSDAADFVSSRGIMNGTDEESFAPATEASRAMVAVILHSMENDPDHAFDGKFHDVEDHHWYADGVHWAAENGLVSGYGNGHYGAGDSVTREQLALILFNYAELKGYDTDVTDSLNHFHDDHATSVWAQHAVQWAVGAGLLSGKNGGMLDPAGTASRAEMAQILMAFCNKVMQ